MAYFLTHHFGNIIVDNLFVGSVTSAVPTIEHIPPFVKVELRGRRMCWGRQGYCWSEDCHALNQVYSTACLTCRQRRCYWAKRVGFVMCQWEKGSWVGVRRVLVWLLPIVLIMLQNVLYLLQMGIEQSLCSSPPPTAISTDASNTIEFDGQKFIVPPSIDFDKQATFAKIETAAKSFCHANRMNVYYFPVITRMIAYRHEKVFMGAWGKLPLNKREDFLEELTHVEHDLMDSFYHHYFKKDKPKPKKSLKNSLLLPPETPAHIEHESMVELGRSVLRANKVAVVLMCAGYSSRFEKEDKFLAPIALYEKVTILDLMMLRLRRNVGDPSQVSLLVNCNEINRHRLERHFSQKAHYGFDPHNVSFVNNFALPIFDEAGEYCFSREVALIKRSTGTLNCAEQVVNGSHYQQWKAKGIQYVYFSGGENLLENPCDPGFLGRVVLEKKQVGVKCTKAQYLSEPLCRYYSQSADHVRVLESSHFEQLSPSLLDRLPVAMNSLVFELETLRRLVEDYASSISLAQHYQQVELTEQVSNFEADRVEPRKCFNFEKDIRYLTTCVKDPLLYKVVRGSDFAPICSRDGEYSFREAVGHYKGRLEKELMELS